MFARIKDSLNLYNFQVLHKKSDPYINRKIFCKAPYSLRLYKQLLFNLKSLNSVSIKLFSATHREKKKVNFFFRHDIDTIQCLNSCYAMLDIEIDFSVSAPCYVRTDEKDYSLDQACGLILKYKEMGVEFGLHTACYTHDNYLKAFEEETEKFAGAFGFRPKTFTVHGLGQYRADVRARFCSEISNRLYEFGYEFTDCCANLRTYTYVIEDCHWNEKDQCRFIYDDFVSLPKGIKPGMNVLVLTHPCYWVA